MATELQDHLLALLEAIKALENELDRVAGKSVYARHIDTIPGFGLVFSAELAGEIGTLQRFWTSDSFAFYLGMAPLDNQSGAYRGSNDTLCFLIVTSKLLTGFDAPIFCRRCIWISR